MYLHSHLKNLYICCRQVFLNMMFSTITIFFLGKKRLHWKIIALGIFAMDHTYPRGSIIMLVEKDLLQWLYYTSVDIGSWIYIYILFGFLLSCRPLFMHTHDTLLILLQLIS